MRVIVTEVTPQPGATVWKGKGFTPEGKEVVFAGDWRQMSALLTMLEVEGEVDAEVEQWQVLR